MAERSIHESPKTVALREIQTIRELWSGLPTSEVMRRILDLLELLARQIEDDDA